MEQTRSQFGRGSDARCRARQLLRLGTGQPDAEFREDQEEAIRHVVDGRGRLLVVQRTGWGKSLVYFIATKLLREAGKGPALLVSPLLALMRNQIAAAERMGVRARRIASDNQDDWDTAEASLRRDEVDILLITPERFGNERFRDSVLAEMAHRVCLLVVDEAHCISDWGHDFRPSYRRIEQRARMLPRNFRLLATTATANNRVTDDLKEVLGSDLRVMRGNLARPSITLQTIVLPQQSQRLAWLAERVPDLPGSGVIYALTVRDAERVAEWLQSRNIEARAYTGGMDNHERESLECSLLENRLKVLVATTALGMGFDKPDVGFVVHYQTPGSVVAYYQQVGRAGRALDGAYGVLLSGEEDTDVTDYFINSAFPSRREVEQVLEVLESAPEGLSVPEMLARINLPRGRITKTMQLLSLESSAPVAKQGTRWQLTAQPFSQEFWARAERLTSLRRMEQRQMQEYVRLESGHMEFLLRALDGDTSTVRPPSLPPLPTRVSPEVEREAFGFLRRTAGFLRRTALPFEPRKQWPAEGMPLYGTQGRIAIERRAETGRALCVWGDGGWGQLVKRGKYRQGRFDDELVCACTKLLRRWNPQPAPTWVTCVPSQEHPCLLRNFAERLGSELRLPFQTALTRVQERPAQKLMANYVQQARNVDGAFQVVADQMPVGPVLLVDDIVDSRWTLTAVAWLLRSHGSDEVWPLALARASRRR